MSWQTCAAGSSAGFVHTKKPPNAMLGGVGSKSSAVRGLHHPFALGLFPGELALTANSLGLFARFFLGRFFEMLLKLHFAKNALTLELLFQRTKRLIDIVVAYTNLHVVFTTFLSMSCGFAGGGQLAELC